MRAMSGGWGSQRREVGNTDICVWKCWHVPRCAGLSDYGGAGVVWSLDGGRQEVGGRRQEVGAAYASHAVNSGGQSIRKTPDNPCSTC